MIDPGASIICNNNKGINHTYTFSEWTINDFLHSLGEKYILVIII